MAERRVSSRERDLAWDYTDTSPENNILFGSHFEHTPLLGHDSTPAYLHSENDRERVTITQHQLRQVIKNLDATRSVLFSLLEENPATESEELRRTDRLSAPSGNSNARRCTPCSSCFTCWQIPQKLAKHLFVITVLLQAATIGIISITDELNGRNQKKEYIQASCGVFICMELINLILLIITSVRLARQVLAHRVNSVFLAQSYLATVLIFAGLYTMTYRIKRNSWKDIEENINQDPVHTITLYLKMLFLSISTATLCGSSMIYPKDWYNYLFVSLQMLLSFVYFAQILAQAMGSLHPVISPPSQPPVANGGILSPERELDSHPPSRGESYDDISIASERLSRCESLPQPSIPRYGSI